MSLTRTSKLSIAYNRILDILQDGTAYTLNSLLWDVNYAGGIEDMVSLSTLRKAVAMLPETCVTKDASGRVTVQAREFARPFEVIPALMALEGFDDSLPFIITRDEAALSRTLALQPHCLRQSLEYAAVGTFELDDTVYGLMVRWLVSQPKEEVITDPEITQIETVEAVAQEEIVNFAGMPVIGGVFNAIHAANDFVNNLFQQDEPAPELAYDPADDLDPDDVPAFQYRNGDIVEAVIGSYARYARVITVDGDWLRLLYRSQDWYGDWVWSKHWLTTADVVFFADTLAGDYARSVTVLEV